jgi:predicted porin
MKKTLVAIAALAAFGAQAQVTITGGFDMGIQALDIKGNKVTQTGQTNGSYTSNVTFAGVEEISKDVSAKFRYEIDPDLGNTVGKTAGTPATGTTSNVTSSLGNGYSYLGLASKSLGEVQFGTLNYATLSANGDGNVGFGTAIGSGYRVTSFDAVRAQNTVSYETPTIAGFSAKILNGSKNDKQLSSPATGNSVNQQNGRDAVSEISAAYVNGPLKVRAAELKVKQYAGYLDNNATPVRGTGEAFKLQTLSANYVMGAATVGAFYQKASSDVLQKTGTASAASTDLQYDRKTTGLAFAYQATPMLKLMVNRAEVKIGDETGASTTDNKKTTVTGLGADYAMSKRTTAYVRYEKNDDKAGARAITGYTAVNSSTDYTATAVGIRHTF